tara:strand:- start:440 stop:916 length:477 start_codon:yes stop_codon:yes gene_type:complete
MAITYRGQASRLNKETKGRNQVGFQDKSAAGDRQGVGGEDVSLSQAQSSFNKRFSSPSKKKNFYGGEAYFADGYGGDLASPAKINPITQKSKSSPVKINEVLVAGAALTGKKFVDASAAVGEIFEQKEEPKAANLSMDDVTDPVETDPVETDPPKTEE